MRDMVLVGVVSTAMAASAGEAPFSLGLTSALFGSTEVGGVDEVDTYPAGLPEAEPEVVSPPLRPGEELTPGLEPEFQPPPFQPPAYRPPVPQPFRPPSPAGGWRYKTVMSGGRTGKNLYDVFMERDHFEIKLLFKKTTWDGSVPFDIFEGRNAVGHFTVGGVLPGSGRYDAPWGEGASDGPRVNLKLWLANELSVEGYLTTLFTQDVMGSYLDEALYGAKVALHVGKGLDLWYAKETYDLEDDWSYWEYEWNAYGADWSFAAGRQHFKFSFCKRDEPTEAFWFMGPFEKWRVESSWYPTKKLKLSFGHKECPDWNDNSDFFSVRWDASRTISLGAYREISTGGDSDLEIGTFWAALRF